MRELSFRLCLANSLGLKTSSMKTKKASVPKRSSLHFSVSTFALAQLINCSNRSWLLCGFPSVRTVRTSWLARSKVQVRSRLVLELGSKQELVRSKLAQELGSKLVQELGSKQVLVRSKLALELGSKLVLVRSKRSLPYGNRTNRLRLLVRR